MIYEFRCEKHGMFEVNQPLFSDHKADCPKCHKPAQRIFSQPQWIFAGNIFRPDGSLRDENDYGVLKG